MVYRVLALQADDLDSIPGNALKVRIPPGVIPEQLGLNPENHWMEPKTGVKNVMKGEKKFLKNIGGGEEAHRMGGWRYGLILGIPCGPKHC